jgi:hypothetical protein
MMIAVAEQGGVDLPRSFYAKSRILARDCTDGEDQRQSLGGLLLSNY